MTDGMFHINFNELYNIFSIVNVLNMNSAFFSVIEGNWISFSFSATDITEYKIIVSGNERFVTMSDNVL